MVGRNLRLRKGDEVKAEEVKEETKEPILPSTPKAEPTAKSKSKTPQAKVEAASTANDSGSALPDPPPSLTAAVFPNLTSASNQPSTPSKTKKGTAKPKAPPKPKAKAIPKAKAGKSKVSGTLEPNLSAIPPASKPLPEKEPQQAAPSPPRPASPGPLKSPTPRRALSPSERNADIPLSPQPISIPKERAPTPPWHLDSPPEPWAVNPSAYSPPPGTKPWHEDVIPSAFEMITPEVEPKAVEVQDNPISKPGANATPQGEQPLWTPSENNPRCPACIQALANGAHREDVHCVGGPPCVQCKGKGWSDMECRMGRVLVVPGIGDVVKGRKRSRVA